eukprot:scaffold285559_cov23-Tisochrysis_lutea.AAC.1
MYIKATKPQPSATLPMGGPRNTYSKTKQQSTLTTLMIAGHHAQGGSSGRSPGCVDNCSKTSVSPSIKDSSRCYARLPAGLSQAAKQGGWPVVPVN